MGSDNVVAVLRQTIETALWMGAPLLIVATVVGLLINVVQVLTSLQDATVSTVPRLFAVAIAVILLLPWMTHRLTAFTLQMSAQQSPAVVGSTLIGRVICADTNAPARFAKVLLKSTQADHTGEDFVKNMQDMMQKAAAK